MDRPYTIKRLNGNLLNSNCYIIGSGMSRHVIVIDPAEKGGEKLLSHLRERSLIVDYVILTHEHYDHIAGVTSIREQFDCQIIASRECARNIKHPRKNFSFYFTNDFFCPNADLLCEDLNHALDWHQLQLRFLNTPGHSPGGICIALDHCLFTGDTILKEFQAVRKIPGSNRQQLAQSIDLILQTFSPTTLIYPGHGEVFRLKDVQKEELIGKGKTSHP